MDYIESPRSRRGIAGYYDEYGTNGGKYAIRGTSVDNNTINDLTVNININIDKDTDIEKLKEVMGVLNNTLPSKESDKKKGRWGPWT